MAGAVDAPKNGTAMSSADNADGSSTDGGEYYYRKDNYTDEETDTKQIHYINFYNGSNIDTIRTTVAQTTSDVDDWIQDVKRSFARQLENNNLVVGLDIEWVRLSETGERNKVAVLQLCLAHQCLIFQFFGLLDNGKSKRKTKSKSKSKKLQKFHVPKSLAEFLNDERIIFVGSGIDQDAHRLMVDHRLTVARSEELAGLAEYKLGREDLYKAGLKKLMWEVLGQDLRKPDRELLSRWDIDMQYTLSKDDNTMSLNNSEHVGVLSYDQIKYACLDAYASFKIGMDLMRRRPQTVNKRFNGNPQKDFNKAPQETNQGQGPKTGNQGQGARGSYKESNRSKPTLMDYWK
ncbi:hypothetical protein MKX03_015939 [Papaver bracteatum]|nr:hypothetical protein MKX03_015939 [Papaver bracteatum]